MQITPENRHQLAWLALAGVTVAAGVILRFTHLNYKITTHDEAFTALRVSGYTEGELVTDLSSEVRPVRLGDLWNKYQRPSSERTVWHTIRGFAREEPQLSPFYYITARLWAALTGGRIVAIRGWSAFLSLLALPCMAWLCWELFRSRFTAAVAVVILSLSPFFLAYSQDARHYSLWMVTILLASAALLRAMRVGTGSSWMLYAVSMTLGLYVGLFTVLVAASHGAYVLVVEKARLTRSAVSYLGASIAAGICFSPWIAVVLSNLAQIRKVTGGADQGTLSLSTLARSWIRVPGKLLYNLNTSLEASASEHVLQYLVTAGSLVLVLFALISLSRSTEKRAWWFVILLILGTWGGLALQDLVVGGQASTGGASNISKYLSPCFLGIVVAIAHLLCRQHGKESPRPWIRTAWRTALVAFVLSQGVMSLVKWQADTWNLHGGGQGSKAWAQSVARAQINQAKDAVLVTQASGWDVIYLSQVLNADVHLWTKPSCWSCGVEVDTKNLRPEPRQSFERFQTVFLYPGPSESLMNWAREQKGFELMQTRLIPNRDDTLVWLKRRQ